MFLTSSDDPAESASAAPEYLDLLLTLGSPVIVALLATWLAHRFTFLRELERARQERLSVAAKAVIEDASRYVSAYERFVGNLSAQFHFSAEGPPADDPDNEFHRADRAAAEALEDLGKLDELMRARIAGLKIYAPAAVYEPLETLMETAYESLATTFGAEAQETSDVLSEAETDLSGALDTAITEVRTALMPTSRKRTKRQTLVEDPE